MKILYVCHRFPYPPKRGGTIRPFNMIRHLHSRGHEVHVASIAHSEEQASEGPGLQAFCRSFTMGRPTRALKVARMVGRLATTTPSSFGFFYSREVARAVRHQLAEQRFDLIIVHCSSVARYVERADVPKMLDFGDMDSQKWREYASHKPFPLSVGYRLEAWKLRREEARLARAFDVCSATTRGEWETLQEIAPGVPGDWFPNGVDSAFFAPADGDYDPDTVVFVGRMDYFPNQQCMFDFCTDVLPLLRARRPATKLVIVGADPPASVRRLGELPGVTVTGSVPDVRPYVRRAALTVAPLRIARGTQNKILEAMAMAVPVVTTTAAARGVDAVPEQDFLVADGPERTADAVLRVLGNPSERARLAAAGRQRMLTHHAWDASLTRLEKLMEQCVAARAARARFLSQRIIEA